MKICLINNLYPPYARGGAEQVVVKTVQGLLAQGHEVVVITTAAKGQHAWKDGKLTIYRYRPRNIFFYTDAHEYSLIARLFWHALDMFHWPSAQYVERILRTERPDVVHTHNLMGIGFLVPRIIRKLGIRHVHTVHDVQLVEPSGIILKQLEHSTRYTGIGVRLYTAIMRRLMGSPDVVVSPSQFLLTFYEGRGFFPRSNRVTLRNPASVEPVASKLYQDRVQFLYVGQIEEHKGILFLVQAFIALMENHPQSCTLQIVGSGSQLSHVEAMSQGRSYIHIHGRVAREHLGDIFREADVTIVPSLCYENSPTVIFESFGYGVPVVASRVEGIAELIEEGKNGVTFDTGNEVALQTALSWCLSHRSELRAMGKNTAASLAGLSEEDYINTLLTLYHTTR